MRVFAPIARVSRRHRGALALSLAGVLAGCDLNPNTAAESLTIAPTTITVAVNGRAPIVGTAFDKKGNSIRDKKISYSTASPSIATVTQDGFVIGISVGATSVSATANGKSATAQVVVTPEAISSVTINPPTFTLRVGNVKPFSATLKNASNAVVTKPVRWASGNSAIASVDQNGTVTANAPGTVQITADVDQVVGTATIQVTLVPIGSCSISPLTQRVLVGAQVQPTLVIRDTANNVLPQLNRAITWTSNNEIVATVSQTGLVTARRAGTAVISASPSDNGQISCQTTVEATDPRVDAVLILPRTGSLRIGIPRQLTAQVLDSAFNIIPGRTVVWTSLTPLTAMISNLGIVTGTALGTARFRASIDGKADTVTFSVTRIPVGSVTIDPLQRTIFDGGTAQFTATIKDSTGTIVTDRTFEWLTNNPTIATVTQAGLARGIAPGRAVISVTSEGLGASADLIILSIPVDTIVAPATFSVVRGTTSGFTITTRDAQGNELRNRVIQAISDLPNIALVPQNSQSTTITVTGVALGETNIRLRALNANGQAEGKETIVRVTVTAPGTGAVRATGSP